jgi:hypothetical protein
MSAFINYHPRPSGYAGTRMIYAAAVGLVLVVLALLMSIIAGSSEHVLQTVGLPLEPF